jgi:hypothetical protein
MKTGTYNKQIKSVKFPEVNVKDVYVQLNYTNHAIEKSEIRNIDLPKSVNLANWEIIEVTVLRNEITKIVVRKPYNHTHDLAIVIILEDLIVPTVWLNHKNDTHKTLNLNNYVH